MRRLTTSAGWRTVTIALTTVMALLFPAAASAATHVATGAGQTVSHHVGAVRGKHKATDPHAAGSRNGDFTTYNWAGYVATNASGSNTTSFNAVQAKWTVPAVTCDPHAFFQFAAFWVGLDGWNNGDVEQDGTDAYCDNGTVTYRAWWEMYPYNAEQLMFDVNAGDTIQASVSYDTAASDFVLSLDDLTSGQNFTKNVPCEPGMSCTRSTAEVISEDPNGAGDNLDATLPDYGTASYSSISVTGADGHTGPMNDPDWQYNKADEVSQYGVTKQTTSDLGADGASFSTTWVAGDGCNNQPEVVADYETTNTTSTTNTLSPNFELENVGCFSIPMSSLTVRYWFTEDGTASLGFSCDYAYWGCSNVSGSFAAVSPVNEADHYLQLSFSGSLAPLGSTGNTGIIQTRIYKTDYSNMSQPNDWSFNANDTTWTANPHITVYYNGQLIYGTEPS